MIRVHLDPIMVRGPLASLRLGCLGLHDEHVGLDGRADEQACRVAEAVDELLRGPGPGLPGRELPGGAAAPDDDEVRPGQVGGVVADAGADGREHLLGRVVGGGEGEVDARRDGGGQARRRRGG